MNQDETIELNNLRDDWCRRFFHASIKGFWSISFVLIFNMGFIWYYLYLKGIPIHWSYFLVMYIFILPLGLMGFGSFFMEPFPTEKRYKQILLANKLREKLSRDNNIYFG